MPFNPLEVTHPCQPIPELDEFEFFYTLQHFIWNRYNFENRKLFYTFIYKFIYVPVNKSFELDTIS